MRRSGLLIFILVAMTLPAYAEEKLLDAPLLFVKRQAFWSAHIYDDYYTWHPGGGIYVIENPDDPIDKHRVRAVIDPKTPETLGEGVYRDPELSYDARRIVFAFKGSAQGDTSIYEIGIDGKGLKRLTDPGQCTSVTCPERALGKGRHDVYPCYLPDGRIVFNSTRQGSRVPCFNSEVDTMHVMNADGSDVHPISVNNVNEFDPVMMPDGRILFGRWEYVDKTALYMQSLWTIHPDGTHETALFGNNMAKPTAFLDARPVPNSHLIVASLTPHNGQACGAIAMIDPRVGKNGLKAITNFTPEYPTEMDQGLKRGYCDPWPLSENAVLASDNGKTEFAVIELIQRDGKRRVIHGEKGISCYSPMLVKPRPTPATLPSMVRPGEPATFFVQDIYQGLPGVKRGEIARLRVIEETSRVSGIPGGGRWWNQAFLLSWQGSYSVKNFLGSVPVEADGSVHFEAPPGRALYFQAIDRDGKLVQSMRTFVQASPGVTRSCVGCHEYKYGTPEDKTSPMARSKAPVKPQAESWGAGFVDYPTMVQPVLDRHCIGCHGGAKDIAAGIDLSGGWTWAFNISYETLIRNTLVGFLNCNNASVKTSDVLPPRTHGSGAAPLAKFLVEAHGGWTPDLTKAERELIYAWMDGNCNYYGTWNWSDTATCATILTAGQALAVEMKQAGCVKCHAGEVGADWINLKDPEMSRILRAPMARGLAGGLGWCRDAKAPAGTGLIDQRHQPPDVFRLQTIHKPPVEGKAVVTFASNDDPHYRAMLAIIRRARDEALAHPRVDMPGATVHPGECRAPIGTPSKDERSGR